MTPKEPHTQDDIRANVAALAARVAELEEVYDVALERKNGPQPRKTRTLYVREEDQAVWDEAKKIIGESLSTYITNHLKQVVANGRKAPNEPVRRSGYISRALS